MLSRDMHANQMKKKGGELEDIEKEEMKCAERQIKVCSRAIPIYHLGINMVLVRIKLNVEKEKRPRTNQRQERRKCK